MIVINLWGGPGCGKSTTASDLFRIMKIRGHRVELVTEFAKELTYDENWDVLQRQDIILPEQYNRQKRLSGHVDYVITDSPIPLNIIYASSTFKTDKFSDLVMSRFNEFDNFNVVLRRVKPYSHYGRKETDQQALTIDQDIRNLMADSKINYAEVLGDEDGGVIIYNILFNNYTISITNT